LHATRYRNILIVLFVGFFTFSCNSFGTTGKAVFSGAAAFAAARHAASFGERPSGSEAIARLREWIVSQVRPFGGQISLDPFNGQTPDGPVAMTNIIVKFPGKTGKAVAITGHYDTKRISMVRFVGANDGGSSTGFLIEFARVASRLKHADDLYIVFFDGEEAVGNWSDTDSLYGSRHLAAKWGTNGTLSRLKALINVDMIGDKDLDVLNDGGSSQSLREMVARTAATLGDSKYFQTAVTGADDDHMPFVNEGVNAIDLLDLDYGPHNSYWHTAADTPDKLSAHSFQVVGDVVLGVVQEIEKTG
jgi:glutaminyl-peptide cyclotransferase